MTTEESKPLRVLKDGVEIYKADRSDGTIGYCGHKQFENGVIVDTTIVDSPRKAARRLRSVDLGDVTKAIERYEQSAPKVSGRETKAIIGVSRGKRPASRPKNS